MEKFEEIYEKKKWGESRLYLGHGGSGKGSSKPHVKKLSTFLCQYILDKEISFFLDIGCGECEWQRDINWKELKCQYIGIEISSKVVERVSLDLSERKDMTVLQGDVLRMDLPKADMVFIKDVFQHWPIALTNIFLEKLYKSFNHCLTSNIDASSSFFRCHVYRYFISKQMEVHDEVVDSLVSQLKLIHWDTKVGEFRPCNFESYGSQLETFKWKWAFPASLIKVYVIPHISMPQCQLFTSQNVGRQIDKLIGEPYSDVDYFFEVRIKITPKY